MKKFVRTFVCAVFLCPFVSSSAPATNEASFFTEKSIMAAVFLQRTTLTPVEFYKAYIQCPRVDAALAVLPKKINKIPAVPDSWRVADVGTFYAKLPPELFNDKMFSHTTQTANVSSVLYSFRASPPLSVLFTTSPSLGTGLQPKSFDDYFGVMNATADDLLSAQTKEQASSALEKIICKLAYADWRKTSYVIKTKYVNAIIQQCEEVATLDAWSVYGDVGVQIRVFKGHDLDFLCQILNGLEPKNKKRDRSN